MIFNMINMMIMNMFIMFIFFLLLFFYFFVNKMIMFLEWEMMKIFSIKLEFVILLDWVSLLFVSIIMLISMMVMFYSIEYMQEDNCIKRFMYLVMLFILSMILMIISPNMLSILLGWDGLGLVSYCLVIFYQNESSFNSGMVTVLTNRIGDIMILMLIGLMVNIGSWNFMNFLKLSNLMMLMILIAAITKSAQIPFSSWLPMAMAAPTPVSSLVHSSTLVTAGIYLLIRFNNLMLINIYLMNFIMIISILTMLLSGIGANFEYDLKKIIALSTLSQLGLMLFCLSLGFKEISFFHLLTHAMFKSMLFMCAGVIIHTMMGNQDIRYIGMISLHMPMISMLFLCSSLSLCGIPFLSGFFSKDLILEMFLMSMFNKMIFILLFFSMGLTVSYSVRLMYYSFIKDLHLVYNYMYISYNKFMGMSMFILYFMTIMIGTSLSWMIFSMKNMIFLTIKFKMIIYIFMFMGIILGFFLSKFFMKNMIFKYINNYIKFFNMLWFMPLMYGFKTKNILILGNYLIFMMEMGWIEYLLGLNLIKFLKKLFKLDMYFEKYMKMLIFFSYLMMILILFF